jgi:hypothetical protein
MLHHCIIKFFGWKFIDPTKKQVFWDAFFRTMKKKNVVLLELALYYKNLISFSLAQKKNKKINTFPSKKSEVLYMA